MHYLFIEDKDGNLVDLIPFCSDYCHYNYCLEQGIEYSGWNGGYEGADYREYCAQCGTYAGGGTGEDEPCDCMLNNGMVARLLSEIGEKCEHGNYIQLPASLLSFIR